MTFHKKFGEGRRTAIENDIGPRLHETGTKSNRDHFVSIIVLFIIDVYMRPERSQTAGPFRFDHSIIYNRCLHETGTKITQTGLKSFRLLNRTTDFRPAWIQIGMNVNTNTFQTCLGCNLDMGTTHANKSHLKKKMAWQRGINWKCCDFRTGLM